MNRYMPLTGHDSAIPTLVIYTQAPLDVLYDAAAYRIRAVTQFLENLAFREEISSDAVVLHDFALLLAIPLRNGCDLLDVVGRKLNSQVS
ncbi:hypothetical protein [Pseudomonas trivialis]|uniref:Short-chain dehydrogenase n=2 Tax=Pseudomonas trivialis TaxID=200450 RepID=A0ABY0U609_9PSED|nr:hypothetical protein [Pseudomonas trivialis]SDS12835.1 hypothetical protein SAMN04490205_1558 [Pseudomonas trivialis]